MAKKAPVAEDETPTIHIEAVQFTPGREAVAIHVAIGEVRMIVGTTQTELGWLTDDPEVVAAAEAGVRKRLGAPLKVKLPEPEAPLAEEETSKVE